MLICFNSKDQWLLTFKISYERPFNILVFNIARIRYKNVIKLKFLQRNNILNIFNVFVNFARFGK